MPIKSPVPEHSPIIPVSVLKSLTIDDSLREQRQLAREILFECADLKRQYYQTGEHPLVDVDTAKWALSKTDHTTLRTTRNEDRAWMTRMAEEAVRPYPMRSVCTWPDIGDGPYSDKIGPLIEHLQEHPEVGISIVLNYPHGTQSPDQVRREIDKWGEILKDVKNPKDIDTVVNYGAWMKGDVDRVLETLKAEGEGARANDFVWKAILMVSVHAYASKNKEFGDDFFGSVYRLGEHALEAGADCLKTSTGVAAKPPFSDFVPKDTGPIPRALPLLMQLRDFNAEHGERKWPKFSGGNENEADAALLRHACERTIGPEMLDEVAFGTSYRFRKQLLEYIARAQGEDPDFDPKLLLPYGVDVGSLPQHRLGLPDPEAIAIQSEQEPKAFASANHDGPDGTPA